MKHAIRDALLLAGVGIALFAMQGIALEREAAAQNAPCTEAPTDDASALVFVSQPPGSQAFVTLPAPATVGITIAHGVIVYPAGLLTNQLRWGDGATSAVAASPCGSEGEYEFVGQTLTHTYPEPGFYTVSWFFNLQIVGPIEFPVAFVTVELAAPTAAPPTATNTTAAPTAAGATATQGAGPTTPGATPGSGQATSSAGTRTASPTAGTREPGTVTPTASASATRDASATPTSTPPAPGETATVVVVPPEERPPRPGQPKIVTKVDGPGEISTEPEIVASNLVIAGMTVWVFFSSILLNQVLSERRSTLEARFAPVIRPLRRLGPTRREGTESRLRTLGELGVVLVLTGAVYAFLEPSIGFNKATGVLLVAAILGSAGVTYASEGLEAILTRRWTGTRTAVRAYPLAVGVAALSVVVSRLLRISPGVMYGFFASTVTYGPADLDSRRTGRLALISVGAGLLLAVGAWLAVGPVRDMESDAFLALALEATLVVIFIEGLETLAVGLIPLGVTDGGKIYRWSRWPWIALVFFCSFVAWHVLFGVERELFGGLREAQSLTILAVFGVYTAASLALWFWLRKED
ncbi:MAG TPA: FGLLP motif-containing membrane protein [Tepidiformaceae bacterium]|nr:FGLLP motif-containing membrane protein [Tepidiformaceae bacterium]